MKKRVTEKSPSAKKKTANTSHPREAVDKSKLFPFAEYFDLRDFSIKPISDRGLEVLAAKLVEWATNNENALKMNSFWFAEGICPKDASRWTERNPIFHRAVNTAKGLIGDRREIGGLRKIYDASIVKATMPHYDTTWLELEEWRSKMHGTEGNGSTQIVIMEKTPDSEMVPHKTPEEVAGKIAKQVNKVYKNTHYLRD